MKSCIVLAACLTAYLISCASFAYEMPAVGTHISPSKGYLPKGSYLQSCRIDELIISHGEFRLVGDCLDNDERRQLVNATFHITWWDAGLSNINGKIGLITYTWSNGRWTDNVHF